MLEAVNDDDENQNEDERRSNALSEQNSEKSELTYKHLPDSVTYTITTLLQILILVLAIFIPSVDSAFEIVGSIASPAIAFIIPAVAYL